jgi:DNA (cytosine-5)-methyltransferase 1
MKAIDLFAGCGGLSLGLHKAGMDLIGAYENWGPALSIYKSNFKHHPVYEIDLGDVKKATDHILVKKPDIIAGGPPCQDFSSAGKRNENNGKGDLTLSFARIVADIGPTWFLMENVDRINKTKIFKEAKLLLTEAGYGLTEVVLDASLCGVPQNRKRMFLIGRKNAPNNFLLETLLSGLSINSMTLRDYFGDKLQTEYYYRHPRSYARRAIFSIDEPSPTVRGVNRPIPPKYKPHAGDAVKKLNLVRPLTLLERARIQTFPANFKWEGPNKSTLEQIIGNAVPVNLAKYVGQAIMFYEKELAKQEKEIVKKPSKSRKLVPAG